MRRSRKWGGRKHAARVAIGAASLRRKTFGSRVARGSLRRQATACVSSLGGVSTQALPQEQHGSQLGKGCMYTYARAHTCAVTAMAREIVVAAAVVGGTRYRRQARRKWVELQHPGMREHCVKIKVGYSSSMHAGEAV